MLAKTILVGALALRCAQMPCFGQASPERTQYDQAIAQARQLLKDKKLKEAIVESERAIKLDDGRWEAYLTAASGYSGLGMFDDAIGLLQIALPRAPQDKKPAIREALQD